MLIWRMVLNVRFGSRRCVALSITAILANQPNLVMSDRRKNFFRWLISVLFCCWNSTTSSTSAATCIESSSGGNRRVVENIEMGPLTLREYVNTLEPYDPEKHGWRGEEPWKYNVRRQYQMSAVSTCNVFDETAAVDSKAVFNGACYDFCNINHIICNDGTSV